MIQIQVNGEFLDLFPDTRIGLRLNSPIFGDDNIIPGSFTIPFDIPGGEVSPNNARIIGNPDVVESRTGLLIYQDATIYFDGCPYKTGELRINPVSGRQYKGNFIFGLKTVDKSLGDFRIRDLVDEVVTLTTETYSKKIYIKPAAGVSTPYKIRVNDKEFEGSTLSNLADAINAENEWVPDISATYVATGSTPLGEAAPYITIEPSESATDPESELHVDSEGSDYTTRVNWYVEVADISTYVNDIKSTIESYFPLATPPDGRIRFAIGINDGMYGEFEEPRRAAINPGRSWGRYWVNYAPDGTLVTNDPNWGANNNSPFIVDNWTNIQPYLRLDYVFNTIADRFNISLEGNFFDDSNYSKACFDTSFVIDYQMPYIGPIPYLFWRSSFNLKELAPDITIEELLKELQKKLNLSITYSEERKTLMINWRKDVITAGPVEDLTKWSGPVEEIDQKNADTVRLVSEIDEGDLLSEEDTFEKGTGNNIITIPSQFSSLYEDEVRFGIQCIFKRQNALDDFKPRLLFYLGEDATDGYPKGTYKGWEMYYENRNTDGLGLNNWTEYLRFLLSRKKVTRQMDIPFRILKDVDWESIYLVDRNRCLFKSIDVSLSMQGVERSKVEFYSW